jgi:phosphate uptake regulator
LEIRKLQKIKGGSYTLSIPKKWVEKKGLQSSHQIVISEEEDGSLSLHPITPTPGYAPTATISLEELPDIKAVEYKVATYYIQGAGQIDVVSNDIIPAETKRRIKLLRLSLPGVEVSDERSNRVSFQVLIDPSAFRLESLLSRTSTFSIDLQRDAVTSLTNWNFPLAKEVIERSGEALRHYRLTIRQVALASSSRTIAREIGVRSCQECVTFALMARDLSRLVYYCSQIASHVLSLEHARSIDQAIFTRIEELSEMAHRMQKDAVQSFLSKDMKRALRVFKSMTQVREDEQKLLREVMAKVKDTDAAVTLALIGRDLRRIAGHSVAIADDGMNRTLRPGNP